MIEQGADRNGQVLGPYQLTRLLGRGGFGEVYEADHRLLQQKRAIKLLLERHFHDPNQRERFLREARTLATLEHPNVLPLLEVGEEGSMLYLVMPFYHRGTLNDLLKQRTTPLPLSEVERFLVQICAAVGYAHARHIAHLDLKPDNMLLHEDGRLVLSDFGLAHLVEQGRLEAGSSAGLGTPYYMAPEQIRGKPELRSDLYSLGIILYQLLTNQRPFTGNGPADVMMKHLLESPPELRAAFPKAPAILEPVVHKALEKRPEDRYATAEALLADFRMAVSSSLPQPTRGISSKETMQHMADQTAAIEFPTCVIPASSTSIPPASLTATQPAQPEMGFVPLVSTQSPLASASSGNSLPPMRISAMGTPSAGTTLATHESPGGVLSWSPDGQRIASDGVWSEGWLRSGSAGIDVWDAITGKTVTELPFNSDPAWKRSSSTLAIVWSPDGQYIVACVLEGDRWGESHRRMTEIWEVSGKGWHSKRGQNGYLYDGEPTAILWSPNLSKVALVGSHGLTVASLRGRERIVHRAEGVDVADRHGWKTAKIRSLSICNGNVVAWSPDGTHIAWGAGNEIPVWDIHHPQREGRHLLTYREHRNFIVAVNWSPDGGQITSRSEDGSEQVWDASNGKLCKSLTVPMEGKKQSKSLVETIKEKSTISPDGALKAVPTTEGIEIRTVAYGETVFVYREHFSDKTAQHWSPEVKALSWSPDGTRIAFARFDGKIYVWQAA